MPTTPRELRRRIEDVQDDMQAQYESGTPFCEIAHQEFEVGQTLLPEETRRPMVEQFRAMGYTLPDDSIKLTEEHRDFHDMLRRSVLGLDTNDAGQLLSAGLAIGRRIGMADAVAQLENNTPWFDTDDPGTTGP
jgi:hypothetical protein